MKKILFFFMLAALALITMYTLSSCDGDDGNDHIPQVQTNGYENGHEWVNLGLPSGTKWATCNIGADKPEAYGEYFAWGEIETKSDYSWSTYKYGKDDHLLTKYCAKSDYGKDGFTDNKTELDLDDDVAHKQWGGSWHMPSKEQFSELQTNTTHEWITVNGISGYKFIASNGKFIFLPAAGYQNHNSIYSAGIDGNYWSRTVNSDYPGYSFFMFFTSEGIGVNYYRRFYNGGLYAGYRNNGHAIRPVCF